MIALGAGRIAKPLTRMLHALRRQVGGRELVALLGLVMMAGGLAMVYVPAALIVPGGLMIAAATYPIVARHRQERPRKEPR